MEELGIIIDQNGSFMNFGKWRPRELRDEENPNDWHDDSFRATVYSTEWFKNLCVPYILSDSIGFHNQLDVFARNGIVVIANTREKSTDPGERRITMAVPDTITEQQIEFLLNKKEELINFEGEHFAFIDVLAVGEDFDIVTSFYHIADFYDYLDKMINERKQQKK